MRVSARIRTVTFSFGRLYSTCLPSEENFVRRAMLEFRSGENEKCVALLLGWGDV
jgi:hypothetical protein